METALDLIFLEPCLFKNLLVREKRNRGACLAGAADDRQKSLLQRNGRYTALIAVVVSTALAAARHIQPFRQCVDNR